MNERQEQEQEQASNSHSSFQELLNKFSDLHKKKNADYSGNKGQYFNFEYAAQMIEPMIKETYDPIHVVFMVMYGIKIAREIVLLEHGRVANNESVLDTMNDLAVYSIIHNACMQDHLKKEQDEIAYEYENKLQQKANLDTNKFNQSYIEPIETPNLDNIRKAKAKNHDQEHHCPRCKSIFFCTCDDS